MDDARPRPIERLLRPRSVAIVGASAEPSSVGYIVLNLLDRLGYRGTIHLVSRSRSEINGRPCVPAIDDLPLGIDAILLIVPEAAAADSVAACARRRAGGVVVLASGFAEVGEEGRKKQERIAAIAREGGLAMLGPNCTGFINVLDRVALTLNDIGKPPEFSRPGVGLIAQSGGMTSNIGLALGARGLPLTHVISSGNEAVTGLEDFLEFLIDDERTRVIALFVEQVRNPRRFIDLVARAKALGKPVVMLHPGRTSEARGSAQSHTGALAGDYAAMRAMLGHEAVMLVDSLDELFDATTLLARWPSPPVLGAAILTNSGGFRGVALDFCKNAGLELAVLEPSTRAALKSILPVYATVGNPLDLTTAAIAQPDIVGRVSKVMLDDPNVGSLIVSMIGGGSGAQIAKAHSLLPLIEASGKPIAFTVMGDNAPLAEAFTNAVDRSAVPFFRSPDRAMRAMACLAAYGHALQWRKNAAPAARLPRVNPPGTGAIPEYLGKQFLSVAGIAIPEGALARNVDEAQAIALRIGFPVVVKAQAAALAHKSDAGGVIAGIADAGELRIMWNRLHDNVKRARPDLALEGALVEKMAAPGVEMIVGARRDPEWGPVVMVGLGGIWAEALDDVRILPADLDESAIVAELRRLKGARVLAGTRGAPALDVRAVAATAAVIGALMRASPEMNEIDINPLVVYAAGKGVQALDVLIVCAESRDPDTTIRKEE